VMILEKRSNREITKLGEVFKCSKGASSEISLCNYSKQSLPR
jgi:hypothetical protein